MSEQDPSTRHDHDLVDDPQDYPHHPRVRLGTVLGLMRIAAGRRGTAAAAWHHHGFSYTLTVERTGGAPGVALDVDPDAPGLEVARGKLIAALQP